MTTEQTLEHTIAALCARSDANARAKGWVNDTDERPFYTTVALFHSELSEALEEWRSNRKLDEIYYTVTVQDQDGIPSGVETVARENIEAARKQTSKYGRGCEFLDAKPEGIPIELADFVIRVCQRAGTDGRAAELQKEFDALALIDDYGGKGAPLEQLLAWLHWMVSGALKAMDARNRHGSYETWLAGALRSVFAFCENNGIDLWAAIDEKEAYNATRSMRHGGKRC